MAKQYRHLKRGSVYTLIGIAEIQNSSAEPLAEGARIAVYEGANGQLWARPRAEFFDGRFEPLHNGRLWWPQSYADESMPEGTSDPSQWIAGKVGALWLIGPTDQDDRVLYGCDLVAEGAIVEFGWAEMRGTRTVAISADGSWQVRAGEPDDYTDCWEDGEFESLGDRVEDVVRAHIEVDPFRPDEIREIDICFRKMGEGRFRLEQDIYGGASFVPVDEARHG